ncbi:hypothetical protein BGZ58_001763 [Dissophora ornata]|nr:hypothetical protein BGZ58_001763 [Dissophora ornata]
MLKNLKDKQTRTEKETSEDGKVQTTTTTEIEASDPLRTTITTTTTTDHFTSTVKTEDDSEVVTAVTATESNNNNNQGRLQRILGTFTRKESTTTTTIQEQPQGGEVTVDSLESTSVLAYNENTDTEAVENKTYQETIDAKFVEEQSKEQNIHGLKHALTAAIENSSAAKEVGKLFEGGILTSANHKKWYHATLPLNWVQKLSSEHHFGNYVVTDRKTGTKTWEDMPIYARIGMHILFASMFDHALLQTHKIHHLFSVESVNQGKHFDAPESVAQIDHFIKTYKLDLSELLLPDIKDYKTFNEFFYRKLRPDVRPINEPRNPNIVVSGADSRLCVFESINAATEVWIKGKSFTIEHLIQDADLAAKYEGGAIAIFRLAPQDYHRFHSPVTGTIAREPVKIDGTYFTVNPMAINEDLDVFTENVRKVTVMDLEQNVETTKNEKFDQCVFVSIGALLVGSIQLTGASEPGNKVHKGEELGYFAYGGSTCILLFKAGAVQFDEDLVANSQKGVETLVQMGERIGIRQ